MSLEKSRTIYQQFKQVKVQIENINDLYGTAKEFGQLTGEDMRFTQAAYDLLDEVKEFVKLIEESDINLDPAMTKLEGVDKFFEGHEATEFVNNAINEVYNSKGICANAPCKAEDKNCCKNKEEVKADHRYEGYCWCGFLKKLHKDGKTIATSGVTKEVLASIEATRDVNGNCAAHGSDTTIITCNHKEDCKYPLCLCEYK